MKRIYFTLIIVFLATLAFSQNGKGVKQFTVSITAEDHYIPGTTMDINFLLDYQTTDWEYGDFISLTFPAGITPNSSPTDPFCPTYEGQDPEYYNGVSGQTISWGEDNDDGWGGIEFGVHPFIVNVTIDAEVTGDQVIDILVSGCVYGDPQGDVYTTCTIQEMPTTPDLSVVAGGIEYTNYPLAQVSSIPVSAEVSNSGTDLTDETDLVVTCDLASYLETAAISTPMLTGGSETFTLPDVTPFTEGNHEIIFEANALGDPYLSNNSDTITFDVDSVYAHDDGGIMFVYGSQYVTFRMGAAFDIITEDDLTAVQFYLGESAPIGDEFSLTVLPVTLSGDVATYGEPVWESENLYVDASMLDTWTTVDAQNSELLEVGKYALLINEHTSNSIELGFDGNNQGDILLSVAGENHYWEDETYGWAMVRLVLGTENGSPPVGDIVFEDDYESYTAGEMVACQNPDNYTTWANDPCGADDAYVSTDQAYSGVNSVNIISNDDLVMDLDEYLTDGKHTVSLMIYVPTGGDAYFNILSAFVPAPEWAFEVYFNAGGDGSVSAGATGAAFFNYDFDTWMESKVVVDLNADWAEYYLDGTLIIEWQWTAGASGGGNALQLGALDFFGATGTTSYYFDDLVIETEEGLDPPTDLTATVIDDNDVDLNWQDAAGSGSNTFIGYNVYRDGAVIAEEIAVTSHTDYDLLPGTYSYDVKAIYDEGISSGAGPAEATILGGVDRDLVIIEVATGTWCQYCPGSAMGVDDLHAEGLSVGIIEYHSGDDYATTESAARITYYGIANFPTAVFDGVDMHVGGSATQSLYATYLPKYESRIGIPSLFTIDAEYYNIGGNNYQVSIDAEMIDTYPWLTNDIVLQVALTESHIPESWQNQTELNFVLRDMITTENGTSLDFAGSATQTLMLDFEIPSNYVMSNLELVVFIQDNNTMEILQGSMAMYVTGIEDVIDENEIAIYPNPANDFVNISASMDIHSITVYNNVGQVISVENVESNLYKINTSSYEPGIYFLQMETNEGRISKRIIIE